MIVTRVSRSLLGISIGTNDNDLHVYILRPCVLVTGPIQYYSHYLGHDFRDNRRRESGSRGRFRLVRTF